MPPESIIAISPIGDLSSEHIRPVRDEIKRLFGYPTEIIPLLDDIEFAYHHDRDQYHSTLILEKLTALSPPRVIKVLGITHVDLFIPILTHVFGEAQLGGKSCIISTYRLREDLSILRNESSLASRILKEAIHELGHTFKLRHCRETACIMHYCRSIKDVDCKSRHFCRYCNVLVEDEKKRLKKNSISNFEQKATE
jgi:archaemetzincin